MSATSKATTRISLDIRGMTCSACVNRLETAFLKTEGVESALVNLPLEKANLVVDSHLIDIDSLRSVVEKTGFDVGTRRREFFVKGMTCSACVSRVESALLNVPGILAVDVNLAVEKATVEILTHAANDDQITDAVDRAGYRLIAPSNDELRLRDEERTDDKETRLLIVACLICIPFMVQMFAQFFDWEEVHMMPAAELVLASILQLFIGARFYRSAFNALRGKTANMDVLVVLGTTAAYLISWYLMLNLGEAAEGELYFEASALILTFVLIGKRLERRAKRATTSAVRELMDLRPPIVRLESESGDWEERPVSELKRGTQFEVRPGDRLAADGRVIEGLSTVDESVLTGESAAVTKQVNDSVFEGTINIDGRLVIETTALAEDSTLQKIVYAIENAQQGKLNVQRLVDKVSAIFAPVVIGIALVVFAAWSLMTGDLEMSLINAVSVLVIACPCALGLATPTAIVAGTGIAAKLGVLYKDVHSVEVAQRVTAIAFDKTGTLTTQQPSIEISGTASRIDRFDALAIAASLQSQSEHPIAQAFVNHASDEHISLRTITNFESFVAEGVSARIDDQVYWLGNERLMRRADVLLDESNATEQVFLATRGEIVAEFKVVDTVRPEAKQAIDKLTALGIDTHLISGDSEERTKVIAGELGISNYQSRLRPEEKVELIQRLGESGQVVGMVGDGVNDAPALARADLGIAMSTGTGVSLEVAPVTLMRNDLGLVATTIQVSQVTFKKIKQNLFWAFIYNVIMLPLAALGFLTPTFAGAAMALSSVSVVCNSLLLRLWKPNH